MKSPAFSFYPKDYESDEDVKLMSLEQEGAYLRLLCHSWLEGSIPSDVPAIARICRTTPAKMARLWPGILKCWKRGDDGRLVNGRQERERAKQKCFSDAQAEKGRKGGRPKKPVVSSGFDSAKAGESLPSPFPSANGSTSTPPNPLAPDRLALERECMALVREVAGGRSVDPTEVMAEASEWKGSRGNMNPAAMSEGRLLNVVLNLRRMRDGQPRGAPSDKAQQRMRKLEILATGRLPGAGERDGVDAGHERVGGAAPDARRVGAGDSSARPGLPAGDSAGADRSPVAPRRE